MMRVCHVLDETARWEQRVAVSQLRYRLPADSYQQRLIGLHPNARGVLGGKELASPGLELLPRLASLHWASAPLLARSLRGHPPDVVHAWGIRAALTVSAASRAPMVLELFDPRLTRWQLRVLRTLVRDSGFALICSSATIRRRLVEGGVPPELCVVVRPGVDFSAISRERRGSLRRVVGLKDSDFAVLAPEPVVRDGGQFETFWAGALASYAIPNLRVLVPGTSREVQRIRRFARTLPRPDVLLTPGPVPYEHLAAIGDALVLTPEGDAPSTAIAWSMAAGALIIAVANYSIAELIANKVNGLLFKARPGESRALPVARLLQEQAAHQKLREVARGQAYEVFGLRRCIDQHAQVYHNLLEGRLPGLNVVDSAMSA